MALVKTLFDRDQESGRPLPPGLRDLYGGELFFPPASSGCPYVIANFVSTLDGVVSYGTQARSSGSAISGADPADRFIMALLRASVDAIVVGARTVSDFGAQGLLTPEYTYPAAKDLFAEYRRALRKQPYPLVVIVSGSGTLDLNRALFQAKNVPTLIITTPAGEANLQKAGIGAFNWLQVRALKPLSNKLDPRDIISLLSKEFGVATLLSEGGPSLFGQFLQANAIDELFLTLASKIAGRSTEVFRPALVQGIEFPPEAAPQFELISAKQNNAFLYLRYKSAQQHSAI